MNIQAIVIVIFVVVGVFYVGLVPLLWTNDKSAPSPDEQKIPSPEKAQEKKLDTTLSPARDLTGVWQGPARWTNNVNNPACRYEGTFTVKFNQQGNALAGDYTSDITKSEQLLSSVPCSPRGRQGTVPLSGTISASSFKFTVATIDFSGTFTSDLMQGTLVSCPNQECADGTRAVGFTGDFSLTRK
ncbi:MAG: hypothetical protein AABY00_04100 [Nanoarchaeota archaeon]